MGTKIGKKGERGRGRWVERVGEQTEEEREGE